MHECMMRFLATPNAADPEVKQMRNPPRKFPMPVEKARFQGHDRRAKVRCRRSWIPLTRVETRLSSLPFSSARLSC